MPYLLNNDTLHVQLYLTLGMLCPEWLTFVSIETGVRFHCGLCNWIWWIRPFMDNGAVELRGHQRALTPCWLVVALSHLLLRADFSTSSICLFTRLNFSCTLYVWVCVGAVQFQSLRDPIWQSESSPSPPTVRHLLLFQLFSAELLTQPAAPAPLLRTTLPASFYLIPPLCPSAIIGY